MRAHAPESQGVGSPSSAEHRFPKIRILIADDFEGWRRHLTATLRESAVFQVVCEVADGAEAVLKARELMPDLILLDIGLPSMNGIAAARVIRQVAPGSTILFFSQEASADVVEEALHAGGRGYVFKLDAGGELLRAIEAVLRGDRFLSSRIAGQEFRNPADSSFISRSVAQQ